MFIKPNEIENLPYEVCDEDWAIQQKDTSLFTVESNVQIEGNILILKLTKDLETKITASVDRKSLILFGHFSIDNAWSNKDDFFVAKKITNLLSAFEGEYKVIVFPDSNRYTKEVSIFLAPAHLVPADPESSPE